MALSGWKLRTDNWPSPLPRTQRAISYIHCTVQAHNRASQFTVYIGNNRAKGRFTRVSSTSEDLEKRFSLAAPLNFEFTVNRPKERICLYGKHSVCPVGGVSGADERLTDRVYRIRVRRLCVEIYDSLSDRQSLTFRCTLLNFLIKLSHSMPKTNQSSIHIFLPFNHTTFLLKKEEETIEPVDDWIAFQHLSLPSLSKCAQYLQRLNWPSRLAVDSLPLSTAIIPY